MSNYLPGSTDYIPQIQPFNPDLNFYAGALATKQQQYDQGLSSLSSLYSSALNSPMSRIDNIERRNRYFKTIEQQVQKTAQLDLSIDQNVTAAKTLFDPIINDQHIVKDMVFTKGLDNSYQRSEQFRNCVDPDKCGGEYWQDGVDALNYARQEFQTASADDSLRFQSPEYVPYQNVTKKAMKAAKDSGFNISYDYKSADGRYNVTDTNGQLLLGPDGQGVLPQYLYGLFGNDSAVQKMYSTQAYVQRKNYARSNAGRFGGSEDAAESEYLNNMMIQVVPQIDKAKNDLTELRDKVSVDKKALEILNKTSPAEDVNQAYDDLQKILNDTESTTQYHEQVSNLITTAPNLNDIKSLRNRVDNVVANSNFMKTIQTAAYDYAMGTSKHEMKADPFALAAYNNSLDLSKSKKLKDYDQQIWLQQQSLLGNIDGVNESGNIIPSSKRVAENSLKRQAVDALIKSNISKEELFKLGITKLDKVGLEKLAKSGLLNKETTDAVNNFASISNEAETFQNTYNENSKVVHRANAQALSDSKVFVKDMLSSMINSYKNADTTEGQNAIGVKAKILVDTKNILEGTGVDYNALIRGEISLDQLNDRVNIKMANTALKIRTTSVSSRVYTDGYSDGALANLQVANQAAEGLYKQRNVDFKKAVLSSLAARINSADNGDLSPKEYQKEQALYTSLVDLNGGMVTPAEARVRYIKATYGTYGGSNKKEFSSAEEESYYDTGNKAAMRAAASDFDNNYIPALKELNGKLTSFNSKPESRDQGGMDAVKNSVEKRFVGDSPLDPNTQYVKNILLDLDKNKDGRAIIYTGAGLNGGYIGSQGVQTSPQKQELFSKVLDKVKSGNPEDSKDLNITARIQYIPKSFDQSAFSFDSSLDKAVFSSPDDEKTFPGEFSNDAVMLKMTIGEKEYRSMYGIPAKESVLESDRSFAIKTSPDFKSLSPFMEGIHKNPQEIYLEQPGNSLSFDLGQKGKAMVERAKDGKLYINATVPHYDAGAWLDPVKETYDVPEQKLENAYLVIQNKLNEANRINQNALKTYLDYARTR